MVILFTAQKPDVTITTQSGTDVAEVERIAVGSKFQVSCDSTGEYKGTVTWMKKTGPGLPTCLCATLNHAGEPPSLMHA